MIYLILDVFYLEKDNQTLANIAGVRFTGSEKVKILSEHRTIESNVAPYESGQFYKREMPCLLALINQIDEPFDVVVIDGFVYLTDDKAGLGKHLYDNLSVKNPLLALLKILFLALMTVMRYIGEQASTRCTSRPKILSWYLPKIGLNILKENTVFQTLSIKSIN